MDCASRANVTRFETYCQRREKEALSAALSGFYTIDDAVGRLRFGARSAAIGPAGCSTAISIVSAAGSAICPLISLVFVQSRDGNTVADNPSTLGGGETDKHLVYEGLSRVDADAVLAGAATARSERHGLFAVASGARGAALFAAATAAIPAQVVVTDGGDLPIERGLMFDEPTLPVYLITKSPVVASLRARLRDRPWVEVVDAGNPVSLPAAMRHLRERGMRVISAIGGRRTATALLRDGLISDIYLTTSPIEAGEPNTPFYEGPPLNLSRVLLKAGGDRKRSAFEHFW